VRREVVRLKLDISEDELQAMLADARRLKARKEQGSWALQLEEEENVRKRQASLAGGQEEGDVNKMKGMKIRKARLRSVNRTRMKVCHKIFTSYLQKSFTRIARYVS
jgi:hypothetical protein